MEKNRIERKRTGRAEWKGKVGKQESRTQEEGETGWRGMSV